MCSSAASHGAARDLNIEDNVHIYELLLLFPILIVSDTSFFSFVTKKKRVKFLVTTLELLQLIFNYLKFVSQVWMVVCSCCVIEFCYEKRKEKKFVYFSYRQNICV